MQAAHGQDNYGYESGYGGGVYADGQAPFAAPGPYDYPVAKSGVDPYWVSPTPQSPQIFSSGDPFQSAFRSYDGFFFRTEYLLYDYSKPGDVLLGAPQFGNINPRDPFEVFDTTVFPATLLGTASVPSLDLMQARNNSGFKATAGVPLIFGSAEASIFTMGQSQLVFEDTTLLGTDDQPFAATTTLVNGAVGDNVLLYNDSFRAVFNTKLWGADSNIFFNGPSSQFFSFSPMIGFKYLDLRENLKQTGSFTPDPIFGLDTVVTRIDSSSANQIYAPQIGLRTKFENSFMAVTFDPKFGLGANVFKNRVSSNHLRSNGDPFTASEDSSASICPVVDLGLNGRLKVTDRISITGGYNFTFISRVTRPQNNIRYNDNGAANPPGIVVDTNKSDFIFQGIMVGVELRSP